MLADIRRVRLPLLLGLLPPPLKGNARALVGELRGEELRPLPAAAPPTLIGGGTLVLPCSAPRRQLGSSASACLVRVRVRVRTRATVGVKVRVRVEGLCLL